MTIIITDDNPDVINIDDSSYSKLRATFDEWAMTQDDE
jgi:hypothetical protein